jgi:sulfur carrier protein ThiS
MSYNQCMIHVTYRDQHWDVPGPILVRDLIEQVHLDPSTVLAVRQDQLVLDSETLGEDDQIRLIQVIVGGEHDGSTRR